jgi:hypothetical protein
MAVSGSTKKVVLISKSCYLGTGLTICGVYYVNVIEHGMYARFIDDDGNERNISMLCFREPDYFNKR